MIGETATADLVQKPSQVVFRKLVTFFFFFFSAFIGYVITMFVHLVWFAESTYTLHSTTCHPFFEIMFLYTVCARISDATVGYCLGFFP